MSTGQKEKGCDMLLGTSTQINCKNDSIHGSEHPHMYNNTQHR